MRRLLLVGLGVGLLVVAPVWAMTQGASAPIVTGPLTLAAGGCQPTQGCSFDYTLNPAATSDPSNSWHAFWLTTAAAGAPQPGSCTTEVTDAIQWASPGSLPTRTFPAAGTSSVEPSRTASLVVDAAGKATHAGGLAEHIAWPAGLVTTVVKHGYMSVVWQGRAAHAVQLVLAAEIANPGTTWGQLGGVNTTGVGVPCSDLAPPGTTFLARVVPVTIRHGQTAWLQLRIPSTYYHWTVGPKVVSVAQRAGHATVVITGATVFGKDTAKPIAENMSDRTSLALKETFPGTYRVSVTLRGPTGNRRYRLRLVVR
jgi:hypothetical protein